MGAARGRLRACAHAGRRVGGRADCAHARWTRAGFDCAHARWTWVGGVQGWGEDGLRAGMGCEDAMRVCFAIGFNTSLCFAGLRDRHCVR